jgi:hypothetical protein
MNDMRPLLDEDATPLEAALLREACAQQPSSAALARTLAALGGVAVATAVSTSVAATAALSAPPAATATAAAAAKPILVGVVVKWLVVIAVVGAAGVGVTRWTAVGPSDEVAATSSEPTVAAVTSDAPAQQGVVPEASSEPAPSVAEGSATSASSAEVAAEVKAAPRPVSSGRPSVERGKSLAGEIALIDRARNALMSGKPDEALALLDQYRRTFPDGRLAPEASSLRSQARAYKESQASKKGP